MWCLMKAHKFDKHAFYEEPLDELVDVKGSRLDFLSMLKAGLDLFVIGFEK